MNLFSLVQFLVSWFLYFINNYSTIVKNPIYKKNQRQLKTSTFWEWSSQPLEVYILNVIIKTIVFSPISAFSHLASTSKPLQKNTTQVVVELLRHFCHFVDCLWFWTARALFCGGLPFCLGSFCLGLVFLYCSIVYPFIFLWKLGFYQKKIVKQPAIDFQHS